MVVIISMIPISCSKETHSRSIITESIRVRDLRRNRTHSSFKVRITTSGVRSRQDFLFCHQMPTIRANPLVEPIAIGVNQVCTIFAIALIRQCHHFSPLVQTTPPVIAILDTVIVAVHFNLGIVILFFCPKNHLVMIFKVLGKYGKGQVHTIRAILVIDIDSGVLYTITSIRKLAITQT